MNHLSEQQEQRLRELLVGRAEHVQIPEPLPPVVARPERVAGRQRLTMLAMAAAIALLAFGSARLVASAPEVNVNVSAAATADPANDGEATSRVIVFIEAGSYITVPGGGSQADSLIAEIESTGASARYVQLRRGTTEQSLADFWSDFPDVEIDNPRTWPNSLRVDLASASDLEAARSQFLAIDGVVRVEPYPECDDETSLFPSVCETTDNRLRDFALATVVALVIMVGLVRAGLLPLRVLVAVVLVVISAGLVIGVVRPVGVELDRAAPAIEQIRTEFGSDLTCTDWYELEIATRPAQPGQVSQRFENIDPALVREALDDGTDIYLWPIWVVPTIMAVMVMLAVAWFLPAVRPWTIVVRVAIVLVVLGGVVSLPTDFKTNGAIQCLAE